MKRSLLNQACDADEQLEEAECEAAKYRTATKLIVSIEGAEVELQDYPEPSRLGEAFRGVRSAMVQLFEAQAEVAKRDLEKLGVTL